MEKLLRIHIGYLLVGLICAAAEPRLMWSQESKDTGMAGIVCIDGEPTTWSQSTTLLSTAVSPVIDPADTRISAVSSRIAFDFDIQRDLIYWSDRGFREIMEADIVIGASSDWTPYLYNATINRVYSGTSASVNGIAYDWLSGSVYWTDSLYNWISVAASSRYDIYQRLVSTDLDQPQGIAVYPQRGMLFWTDWGAIPKMEMSKLDGSDRRVVLQSDDMVKPQGLSIDYVEDAVYWVDDSSDSIHSYDIVSGITDSFKVLQSGNQLSALFGIAIYNDYLFVTDQNATTLTTGEEVWSLRAINKTTRQLIFSKPLEGKPYDVTMYHENRQQQTPSECPNMACEHMCVSMGGTQGKCICAESYQLNADGRTCDKVEGLTKPIFLYTIGHSICGSRITIANRGQIHPADDVDCFITNVTEARALAFHSKAEMLFYSDASTRTIERIRLVAPYEKLVITVQTGIVTGMAVDWMTDNLYWTDETFGTLNVVKLDGSYRQQLLSGLDKPQGLTLDPFTGLMYWTEAGDFSIWVASMDGSDKRVFISDMQLAVGIVMDIADNKRIYWAEGNGIKSILADGATGKATHVTGLLDDFYGVTVFADFLAWTDGSSQVSFKEKNPPEAEVRVIRHIDSRVSYDVITYGDYLQPRDEPGLCDDETIKCEQICLPKPGGKVCACTYGYTLAADGFSCSPITTTSTLVATNFMLFVDPYMRQIFQVDLSLPSPEPVAVPVQCASFPTQIDYDWSNGDVYCLDGSSNVIKKVPLAGGNSMVALAAPQGSAIQTFVMSASTREILYTDIKSGNIMRSGVTRSVQSIFATSSPAEHMDLDVDTGYLYWSQPVPGNKYGIYRQFLTGPQKKHELWTSSEVIQDIAIDRSQEKLYWCTTQKILWSNYDGTDVHVLVTDIGSNCLSLAVTDKYIYISHYDKTSLYRMNKSGNETVDVTGPVFSRITDLKDFSWITDTNYSVPIWTLPNENTGGITGSIFDSDNVLGSGMSMTILIGAGAGALVLLIFIIVIIAVVCQRKKGKKLEKTDFQTQAHENPIYATTEIPPPITDAPDPIYHTLSGVQRPRPSSGLARPASTGSRDSDLPDVCIVCPSDDESGAINDKEQLVNPTEISLNVNDSKISYNPNAEKF